VRTLVVSDLHLGSRVGRDVLRAPVPRARLLEAVRGVDRLILLGDTLELLEARPRDALTIAIPILREIGAALGPDAEVDLVPGNHDRFLIRDWLATRPHLTPDTEVPVGAGPLLETVAGALAPARVTVRYPGLWVAPGIWATHGHYLDRHLLPSVAYGIARGLLGRVPRDGATPDDYEQRLSVTALEGPLTRSLPRLAAAGVDDLVTALRRATIGGPLSDNGMLPRAWSHVLGLQMRRASIPALARVVHRLGVDADADAVIFGHVHRAGPRNGDDPAQWSGPTGTPRIYNTGSWVHEPVLLHRAEPSHVYWPGGAVLIEDGAISVLALLEDVPVADLRAIMRR
jgi:UDP-2,3-diacylglucosamine pyrophosphatase LpxH